MPLCYSAIPSRSLRRDGADLKGLGFPNKYFATQNGLCIYEDTACYNGVGSEKLTASELFKLCIFV